ncbi:MAG: hypothetical protein LBR91_01660 [Puniceicoccales bacterium]|jgi:hypothetical protein|nr:hypothetical protein [Puniceicoccales bacterium]
MINDLVPQSTRISSISSNECIVKKKIADSKSCWTKENVNHDFDAKDEMACSEEKSSVFFKNYPWDRCPFCAQIFTDGVHLCQRFADLDGDTHGIPPNFSDCTDKKPDGNTFAFLPSSPRWSAFDDQYRLNFTNVTDTDVKNSYDTGNQHGLENDEITPSPVFLSDASESPPQQNSEPTLVKDTEFTTKNDELRAENAKLSKENFALCVQNERLWNENIFLRKKKDEPEWKNSNSCKRQSTVPASKGNSSEQNTATPYGYISPSDQKYYGSAQQQNEHELSTENSAMFAKNTQLQNANVFLRRRNSKLEQMNNELRRKHGKPCLAIGTSQSKLTEPPMGTPIPIKKKYQQTSSFVFDQKPNAKHRKK